MYTLLKNGNLVQDSMIEKCDIIIKDGYIDAIVPCGTQTVEEGLVYDLKNLYVSPGFIDIHLHGGDECDFMDGTFDAFKKIARIHLTHGTTAMAPTTLAASNEELLKTLIVFDSHKDGFDDGAKFIGIHIEGPYINKSQAGAQDLKYIRNPEKVDYAPILEFSKDIIRWTVAPELNGALEFGDVLRNNGILPCIGHSQATITKVKEAIAYGYTHITHLYSATSSIVRERGFRKAGIIESAYLFDELTSEIIADGCHLPKELLQLAYKFIGPKRLVLITDAMRGTGKLSGKSILGSLKNGQEVILEDGVAKLMDRSAFAGSIATMDRLVRTMYKMAEVPLQDAIRMVTQTPAEVLGVDEEYGILKRGRAADITIYDNNINILKVFINGKIKFEGGKS